MKYAFIRAHSDEHAVTRMGDLLGVSSSGYYDWYDRPESTRSRENRTLTNKIHHYHQRSNGVYGSPKIHKDLLEDGEHCGVNRVARLMKQADIQSKLRRKFVITTDSKSTTTAAPDLLQRNFTVAKQNDVWVSDTTFIPTREGWLYLAVILDLFSRQVIGWAMSKSNNTELVQDALTMAIWRRGKAECLDNAVADSFFGSLKNEWVYHEDYRSRQEATQSIFEYIEVFYNRQRRHATLNYMTPAGFEAMHAAN